jgi:hypothetical protein
MAKFSDIFGRFRKGANDDSDYQEYLLGGLSSARRKAIEQSSIFDDQVSDSISAAEEALLQGYAEGGLTPAIRERFEALIASSAAWRQKAKLAKALSSLLSRQKRIAINPGASPVRPDPRVLVATTSVEASSLTRYFPNVPRFQSLQDEALRKQLAAIVTRHLSLDNAPGLNINALVDEAKLRLGITTATIKDHEKRRFLVNMARMMRQILVHNARTKQLLGDLEASEFEQNLLSIDAAFADLEATNPRASRVFELVAFAGLALDAAAEILGVSPRTAERDLAIAKSLLASAGYKNEQ